MNSPREWSINEGDTVDVYFENVECIFGGIVRHMAQATGECWVIETPDYIHYIQTFVRMTKLKPRTGEEPF